MKPFNFLTTQLKHKNSFKQWLIVSLVLCICVLLAIALISLRQIKLYSELKRKKTNLNKDIHKQAKLLEKYHNSRKAYMQYQKLVTLAEEPRIFPHTYLTILSATIPIDVFLTDCSYRLHNKLLIQGKAKTTRAITDFVRNLTKQAQFKSVALLHVTALPDLCVYEIQLTL